MELDNHIKVTLTLSTRGRDNSAIIIRIKGATVVHADSTDIEILNDFEMDKNCFEVLLSNYNGSELIERSPIETISRSTSKRRMKKRQKCLNKNDSHQAELLSEGWNCKTKKHSKSQLFADKSKDSSEDCFNQLQGNGEDWFHDLQECSITLHSMEDNCMNNTLEMDFCDNLNENCNFASQTKHKTNKSELNTETKTEITLKDQNDIKNTVDFNNLTKHDPLLKLNCLNKTVKTDMGTADINSFQNSAIRNDVEDDNLVKPSLCEQSLDSYYFVNEDVTDKMIKCHFKETSSEDNLECSRCEFVVCKMNISEILVHLNSVHRIHPGSTTCFDCKEYFLSATLLKLHNVNHHCANNDYVCKKCSLNFRIQKDYNKHMVDAHLQKVNFFCCQVNGCDYCTSSKSAFSKHKRAKHSIQTESVCICEFCGVTCSRKHNLDNHQVTNCPGTTVISGISNFPYSCQECKKAFPTVLLLKKHTKQVHSGPHKCPISDCSKEYRTLGVLQKHIQTVHRGKWKVECTECGLKLCHNSALKLHMKTLHEKKKDIKCPWPMCTATFGRQNACDIHYMKHTKEKRLKCEYCSFGAVQRSSMNYHMKTKHVGLPYNR